MIEVDALVTHVVFPIRQRNNESVFFADFPPAVPTIDMVNTFGRRTADDACFKVIELQKEKSETRKVIRSAKKKK